MQPNLLEISPEKILLSHPLTLQAMDEDQQPANPHQIPPASLPTLQRPSHLRRTIFPIHRSKKETPKGRIPAVTPEITPILMDVVKNIIPYPSHHKEPKYLKSHRKIQIQIPLVP